MSRARTRRPGTRSGRRAATEPELPDDLPSAAAAALDDLLTGSVPPESRAPTRRPTTAATVAVRAPAGRGESYGEELVVIEETELPEVATLRFAIFEDGAELASAQGAIVAAGHVVAVGGSGPDGSARVIEAVREGTVDALIVGLPASGAASAAATAIVDAALALEPRRPIVIAAL